MEFDVTITRSSGEEIDVCVDVDVDDADIEIMRDCVSTGRAIDDESDLEDLMEEIREEALFCAEIEDDEDDDEEFSFDISVANEEDLEDCEPGGPDWGDYVGYPFAMEVVNGEIISLTAACERKIVDTFLARFGWAEERLAGWLRRAMDRRSYDEPEENDPGAMLLSGHDVKELAVVFGFNKDSGEFAAFDIGFLESAAGWTAKRLLNDLGIPTKENIDYGPHGHGTTGVRYIESL